METLRYSGAKVREPWELQFRVVRAVGGGIAILDGGGVHIVQQEATERVGLSRGLFSHFTPTLQLHVGLILAASYVASYTYDAGHEIVFPAGRRVLRRRREVSEAWPSVSCDNVVRPSHARTIRLSTNVCTVH